MPGSSIQKEIAFNRCVVRPAARQILVDGQPAKLSGRAFDLLLTVIDHRDRVVSKHELLNLVWPGLIVEENNLQVHISALRKLLGPDTIATVQGRGYQFTAAVSSNEADVAAAKGGEAGGTNSAFTPSLFGRDDDLAALSELLASHRLITIVGAGGIGKTALAQVFAKDMHATFADGAHIVDLAPLTQGAQLAPAIASAVHVTLGAGPTAQALVQALKARDMLIVLDNCEHLVHAVAGLAADLLASAPKLRIVATSQEPLKLVDEQVYRVGTLGLPSRPTLVQAREAAAVRLFVSRAHAADSHFELDKNNVESVVDICTQLDGIALGIELAAARVQLLGVLGVRERLGKRLFLLNSGSRTGPVRHRTLRAALEWSHTLLSPPQQAVFRRLGVMSGPFGMEASQKIAADTDVDEWAVLDHLGALVEKSLVAVETNAAGEARYRLLETMRQYALERMEESGETAATRERHLAYFLDLAERAKPELAGANQGAWLARLDLDRDNLLAAHSWCDRAPMGTERGLKLVNALMRYWLNRGMIVQGYQAYMAAMARPHIDIERHEMHKQLRAEALRNAGWLCSYRGIDNEAKRLLIESVSLARDSGFADQLADGLSRLGYVHLNLHERGEARACLEEALSLARQIDSGDALVSQSTTSLAELERIEGNLDAAQSLYVESLRYARMAGDHLCMMIVLNNLAMLAVARGDDKSAATMMIESLSISDALDSRRGRLVVMEVCAGLASHLSQWQLAINFDAASDVHTVQMGRRRDVADAAFLVPFVERARAALGADFIGAQTQGQSWSYDEAVDTMKAWLTQLR